MGPRDFFRPELSPRNPEEVQVGLAAECCVEPN